MCSFRQKSRLRRFTLAVVSTGTRCEALQVPKKQDTEMRAVWNGMISFGLVNIPVGLFTAVKERPFQLHFLHQKDQGRIRNQRVCEECNTEIEYKDLVRGYEYEKGRYAVRSPSPQRGRGARDEGASTSLELSGILRLASRGEFRGVDSAERYPPHPPAPLPRWGEGS